jgi:hypothetical protein
VCDFGRDDQGNPDAGASQQDGRDLAARPERVQGEHSEQGAECELETSDRARQETSDENAD